MRDKQVVITGLGAVTPLDGGSGIDRFWEGLCKGQSAIKKIRDFNVKGFSCRVGGKVDKLEDRLKGLDIDAYSRAVKMFALAACHAVENAGINNNSGVVGVCCGSILGCMDLEQKYLNNIFYGQDKKKDRSLLHGSSVQSIPAFVGEKYNFRGPNICVSTACSSSSDAIILAVNEIKNGRADIMLSGGVDILSEFLFRGFSAIKALTIDGYVRPFDKNRTGLAVSEGAGIIVLEDKEHALKRGSNIYCTLKGAGSLSEAYNLLRPHAEGIGLAKTIDAAIVDAGVSKQDIDYISAHGTGTYHNDISETNAIKLSLGEHAYKVKVSAIKSMIGHTMGAAAVLGAISCIKAIAEDMIPPTINYETPDPDCDLNYVTNSAYKTKINKAMSLSAGFGGQNSALIFSGD